LFVQYTQTNNMPSILGKRARDETSHPIPTPTPLPNPAQTTTFATTSTALAHQRAIDPTALWQTITTLSPQTLQETLFNAATGQTSYSQILFQIFDLHHTRIRQENEDAAKTQKAELARQKARTKKSHRFFTPISND
jgi:hypothetical protein